MPRIESSLRVAALQMEANSSVRENLAAAEVLIAQAAARGATWVSLPEYFFSMASPETFPALAEPLGHGPLQDWLAAQAKVHKIYLLAGSLPFRVPKSCKIASGSLLVSPAGTGLVRYNKRHLFDQIIPGSAERHCESDYFVRGEEIITEAVEGAKVGFAICYDLRFPEHFRALSSAGAEIFAIPSAFTKKTGEAHWHVLLRARALENLSYVVAPNLVGSCEGKQVYGHSLIVGPWGEVLAEASGTSPEVLVADLDLEKLRELRRNFPVLAHRR